MSHEFKTPLTLIKGPLERLQKNPGLTEEEKQQNYGLIKQNVRILMRLISQLMDFRKLDQKKMEISYTNVEVNNFVEKVCKSFVSWAEQKELVFSFTPGLIEVHTVFDKNKMELVLYNIISNAFKNTPNKGKVNVRVEKSKAKAEFAIVISDTGVGISPDDQPHIFERFYQSKDHSRKNYGGTGIGLAYAKALVELQNGSITFESEKGVGSTFVVHMPVKNTGVENEPEVVVSIDEDISLAKELSSVPFSENQPDLQPGKSTLLVVDDNYDLRHFIARELNESFNIVLAEDGLEGLANV